MAIIVPRPRQNFGTTDACPPGLHEAIVDKVSIIKDFQNTRFGTGDIEVYDAVNLRFIVFPKGHEPAEVGVFPFRISVDPKSNFFKYFSAIKGAPIETGEDVEDFVDEKCIVRVIEQTPKAGGDPFPKITDVFNIDEASPTLQKKKRKKKASPPPEEEEEDYDEEEEAPPPPPKKRRGRPRKKVDMDEEEEEEAPRKKVKPLVSYDEDEEEEEEEEEEAPPPKKQKRGRPRKKAAPPPPDDEDDEDYDEEEEEVDNRVKRVRELMMKRRRK